MIKFKQLVKIVGLIFCLSNYVGADNLIRTDSRSPSISSTESRKTMFIIHGTAKLSYVPAKGACSVVAHTPETGDWYVACVPHDIGAKPQDEGTVWFQLVDDYGHSIILDYKANSLEDTLWVKSSDGMIQYKKNGSRFERIQSFSNGLFSFEYQDLGPDFKPLYINGNSYKFRHIYRVTQSGRSMNYKFQNLTGNLILFDNKQLLPTKTIDNYSTPIRYVSYNSMGESGEIAIQIQNNCIVSPPNKSIYLNINAKTNTCEINPFGYDDDKDVFFIKNKSFDNKGLDLYVNVNKALSYPLGWGVITHTKVKLPAYLDFYYDLNKDKYVRWVVLDKGCHSSDPEFIDAKIENDICVIYNKKHEQ